MIAGIIQVLSHPKNISSDRNCLADGINFQCSLTYILYLFCFIKYIQMLSQTSLNKNADVSLDTIAQFRNSSMWAQLPLKIKRLLEYLQYINQNSNNQGCLPLEASLSPDHEAAEAQYHLFCSVFKRLSQQEQQKFLQQVMRELQDKFQKGKRSHLREDQQEYDCQVRVTTLAVPHWTGIRLRLNWKRRQVILAFKQRVINLYLRQFMLRRSKVYPQCFVFEYVGHAGRDNQYNYHLKFQSKTHFYQLEEDLRLLIACSFTDQLLWDFNQHEKSKMRLKNIKLRLFLTPSIINRLETCLRTAVMEGRQSGQYFLSDRQSQEASIKATQFQRYRDVTVSEGVTILCNQNDDSLYIAKFLIEDTQKAFVNNFLATYKAKHKFLMNLNVLERESTIQQATHSAIYQKITWRDMIYGQLLICREENVNQPLLSTPTLLFSFMDIDHTDNQNFIQYLQVTAHKIDAKLQVNIFGKFHKGPLNSNAIQKYIRGFIDVLISKESVDLCKSKFGKSLPKDMKNSQEEPLNKAVQPQGAKKHAPTNQQIENVFSDNLNGKTREIMRTKISKDYLRKHYKMVPTKQKTGVIMKEHFLWSNWRRAKEGGLVCSNEELVERQKKMFKLILKKFGETLIMGKNIINFSLPVVVFKKESHLESIAKSYLYAPIFTQKAAKVSDPLQRMKLSIVLMITECSLSIHMEKPFNPILGETFQGWIDGCPIYLEQISHHPPVSAYYLVGRGYKKYGCIEPKISVGLNSGSGYSLFPHFVQFDDGGKIEYICAKICIGGLLIGERTFNFKDQIYAYDRKNRFFASLKFGPVSQGFFSSSDEPEDYFHGHIYRVKPSFQKIFDEEKGVKPHPEAEHIQEKLSFFDGIWSSSVNIDGKEVLNLKSDLPYQFTYEDTPLPSNSSYREDLSNLLAGDLEAAQMAKEEMEELQRRDRKLREEYIQ